MKTIKILAVYLLVFISITAFAQNKPAQKLDRIIKRDYQIIEGNISKISEKEIEYTLPNEKLINALDVARIARIEFANGRVQTFDATPESQPAAAPQAPVPQAAAPAEAAPASQGVQQVEMKENVIAVLPIPYVNSDNMASSEEMAKFAQNDVYSKIIQKSANIFPLTVQDLRETNSLLKKAGIDYRNIDDTPISDLHKILGVDHIICAKVSYTTTENQTSSTYNSGNAKVNNNKLTGTNYSSSNTNTNKYYSYHVYFDLYKNNTKIYTQSRQPTFRFQDSWIDAMSYLLKRSPIYTK